MKNILIGTIIFLLIGGCNKYEDGPTISFVSPIDRITNSWKYDEVFRNGLDITAGEQTQDLIYTKSSIGFAEDGRFSYIEDYRDSALETGDGFWEFNDNKTIITLIYDDANKPNRTLNLTRLERRFLWFSENLNGNNVLTFKMVSNE